jgi:hypothetical protein
VTVGFRVRAQGGAGRFKGEARDLGVRARAESRRDRRGRCCAAHRSGEEEREEEGHCRAGPSGQRERERAGQAGLSAGRRRRWAERERIGPARGKKGGPRGQRRGCGLGCWASWGLVFGFLFSGFSNSFSISFSGFQTQIYLNSTNLNSNPYALNQIKFMHQDECTNMLN